MADQLPNPLPPNPTGPNTPNKILAFRVGLALTVLGVILLGSGIPGLATTIVGIIMLIFSGFFDRFKGK